MNEQELQQRLVAAEQQAKSMQQAIARLNNLVLTMSAEICLANEERRAMVAAVQQEINNLRQRLEQEQAHGQRMLKERDEARTKELESRVAAQQTATKPTSSPLPQGTPSAPLELNKEAFSRL